jgi:hypothetical protein
VPANSPAKRFAFDNDNIGGVTRTKGRAGDAQKSRGSCWRSEQLAAAQHVALDARARRKAMSDRQDNQ